MCKLWVYLLQLFIMLNDFDHLIMSAFNTMAMVIFTI